MDECKYCTLKGKLTECEIADCNIHKSWYVAALKTKQYFETNQSTFTIDQIIDALNDSDHLDDARMHFEQLRIEPS
jgi:hypothetical protein